MIHVDLRKRTYINFRGRLFASFVILALCLGLLAPSAFAAPIQVANEADLHTALLSGSNVEIELTAGFNITMSITILSNNTARIYSDAGGPYTLTRDPAYTGSMVVVSVNSTLTLEDIILDGNKDAVDATGPIAQNAGTLTLGEGAVLQNNKNTSMTGGAGVYQTSSGTLTIDGATITGNVHTNRAGGGIASNGGTVIMNSGTISNNSLEGTAASGNGGGIYVANSASFTMNGGTISGNSGKNWGGGICVNNSSSLTINGGTISGNTCPGGSGGGIYVSDNSSAYTIDGAVITGNSADDGGGIASSATGTISHTKITNNTADPGSGYGGGIENMGTLNLGPDVEVTGNTAYVGGGIMALMVSVLNIDGAIISNNTAVGGGGIYTMNELNIVSGTLDGNKATGGSGGAIYFNPQATSTNPKVDIQDAVVSNNYAAANGGGVNIANPDTNRSKVTVSAGAKFSDNSIGGQAYAIDLDADDPQYHALIHSADTEWTKPFDHGYNNVDISYTSNKPVQIVQYEDPSGDAAVEDMPGTGLVDKGEKLAEPESPKRAGYRFMGWDVEGPSGDEPYDFEEPVNENLTLRARWAEVRNVDFDSRGGTAIPGEEVVLGEAAEQPDKDPEKDGYRFEGWYTDPDCTDGNEYDFSSPVDSDITLYAKWAKIVYVKVTFVANGGSPAPGQEQVEQGDKAIRPLSEPVKDGYVFGGWYTDPDCTDGNEYSFDDPVDRDITLYAKWTKADGSASSSGGSASTPGTGDNSHLFVWILASAGSLTAAGTALFRKRRMRDTQG